jgi:uncharacterized DUF497 family protein
MGELEILHYFDCMYSDEGYSRNASCALNLISMLGIMVFNATFNNISVISWRRKEKKDELGLSRMR